MVAAKFGLEPLDRPAEQQDAARVRVLERRHVGQLFLLRRLALEHQHVVCKENGLVAAHRGRDPRVRRIARLDGCRVRPPGHRQVELGCQRRGQEHHGQAGRGQRGLPDGDEEQRRDNRAGGEDGQRKRLHARNQGQCGHGRPRHGASALDGVAGGQRPPVHGCRPGRVRERQAQRERDGRQCRSDNDQLLPEREERPRDATEQHAAAANERDIEGQRERDDDEQPRHVRG